MCRSNPALPESLKAKSASQEPGAGRSEWELAVPHTRHDDGLRMGRGEGIGGSAGVQRGCDEEGTLDEGRRGSTAAGERSGAAAGCAGVEMVMGWAVSIVGQVRLGVLLSARQLQ